MKRTMTWLGAALMVTALMVACGAAKKEETLPAPAESPAGGGAYGASEANPCGAAPANPCGAAPANPCGAPANPCGY
ncbi:MAG: hypothetical protein EXR73_11830 [Myxococcales bacterium]|nr:hypothetical protein [Myxococcales bacterium]